MTDTRVTRSGSRPVLWNVVDKDGNVRATFSDPEHAAEWAMLNMPGEQDSSGDYENPNGWDVVLQS